jgi:PAS domain S-box-containing protein
MDSPLRVLYVDDEPDLLEIGKVFLEQAGEFAVTTIDSAPTALDLLKLEQFDAVVSDYQMAGMDGIQFLVEVRTRFGPVPFILFTGKGREEVVIQAINSGADFYLQKGGNPEAQFAELAHKIKQATSRKRADDALRKSEEQHRTILQTTLDGIWMVNAEGKIADVNETYCRMSGYTRAELLNLHVTDLDAVEKPAETTAHLKSIVDNGSGIFESSHRRKDGSVFDVEVSTTYLNADGGKFICFCRDITERKKAELERISTQERLKEAHRLAKIGTWDWVMETDTVIWSEELCNIAGWDPSLPAPTYAEFPHIYTPSSWELLSKAVTRALTTGEPYNLELEMIRPDGSIRWTNAFGGMNRDGEGKVIGLHGTVQDITGRKVAEEELRVSEEKFRKAFFTSPDSICITRLRDGLFVSINKGFTEITGYTEEDVAGKTSLEINIWKDPEDRRKIVEGLQASGEVRDYEARFLTKTGEIYGVMSSSIIELNGVPHILNITHDLTGRKQAEEALIKNTEELHASYEELTASEEELRSNLDELTWQGQALRESEQRFDLALEGTGAGLWDWDMVNDRVLYSAQWKRMLGYEDHEVENSFSGWKNLWHPDDSPNIEKALDAYLTGKTDRYENIHRLRHKDGSWRWIVTRGGIIKDSTGKPVRWVGTNIDITGRKKAEEALIRKTEDLHSAYEELTATDEELRQNVDDLAKSEQALRTLNAYNRSLLEASLDSLVTINPDGKIADVNTSTEKITGYSRDELIGTDFSDYFTEPEQAKEGYQRVFTDGTVRDYPLSIQHRDSHITPVLYNATVYRDEIGNVGGVFAAARDITERKRAEEALRESERFFRAMFESSSDMIHVLDTSGRISSTNIKNLATTGYTQDEFVGKKIFEFFTSASQKIFQEQFPILMEQGHNRSEVEFVCKDGSVMTMDCSASAVRSDSGAILNFVVFQRDITERKRVEVELLESRQRFQGLVETLYDWIWEVDCQGRYNYVSPRIKDILGYEPEELLGKTPFDIMPAEEIQRVSELFGQLLGGQKPIIAIENKCLHKDGHLVIMETSGLPFYDTMGNLKGYRGTDRDITDRKAAEETLRESEVKFRIHIENSFDVIFTLNSDGEFVFVSPAWERHFGYPVSDVIGKSFAPFVHPDDIAPLVEYLKRVLITGQSEASPAYRVRHADGRWLWLIANGTPIVNTKGEQQFVGVGRDITERKVAEEALKEHDEKTRLLLDSTAEAIYGLDMNGNCTFCNNSCLRLLGYKHPRELLGKNMHWQIHAKYPDGTHFPVEDCRIFRAFNKGEGTHVDDEVLWRSDGTSFPAEYWSYPQRHEDKVVGAVVTFLDITERKELEKEMEYHAQELQQYSTSLATANKKLNLLSSISRHDINNQLTVLMGYLTLLEQKQPDPINTEYFLRVSNAAKRISAMIKFTKEYEEIGVHAPTWQDCRTLVETAAKQAPLGMVVVKNDLPAGAEMFADPLVVKVFYNLMDNAVRYGGKITTIRFSVQESGDEHLIVCEDDGDGIVVAEKEKIFERGFGKNTGLGLALSREILAITGITITETGEPGKGARFEMTVPKGAWGMTGGGA